MAFRELHMDCVFPGEFPQGNCPEYHAWGGELTAALTDKSLFLAVTSAVSHMTPGLLSMHCIIGSPGVSVQPFLMRRDFLSVHKLFTLFSFTILKLF